MLNHTTYAEMSEQSLIERIKQVSILLQEQPDILTVQPELDFAFAELWSRWRDKVGRRCRVHHQFSEYDASEVQASVQYKMWHGLSSFEFRSEPQWRRWIYTIVDNAAHDYRRREAKRYIAISLDSQIQCQDGSMVELGDTIADTYYEQMFERMQNKHLVIEIAEQQSS